MEHIKKSLSMVDSTLSKSLSNKNVVYVLQAALILYAGLEAPKLMGESVKVFDSVLVRLVVAGLIVYLSHHNAPLALLLAIALVVSIQQLNVHKTNQAGNDSFFGGHMEEEEMMTHEQEDTFQNPEPKANQLTSGGSCPNGEKFTTDQELHDAQSNTVEGVDQESQVQTWQNQLGPQGLGEPQGFDAGSSTAADF